jgi:hypothetical protein
MFATDTDQARSLVFEAAYFSNHDRTLPLVDHGHVRRPTVTRTPLRLNRHGMTSTA